MDGKGIGKNIIISTGQQKPSFRDTLELVSMFWLNWYGVGSVLPYYKIGKRIANTVVYCPIILEKYNGDGNCKSLLCTTLI